MSPENWDLVIKLVLTVLSGVVVPWAILAYQRRTGVTVTDQQRAAVYAALQTAAGIIQTKLDQGAMTVHDVHVDNPVVMTEARAALARVPDAAAAQAVSPNAAAAILVGRVNTSPQRGPLP